MKLEETEKHAEDRFFSQLPDPEQIALADEMLADIWGTSVWGDSLALIERKRLKLPLIVAWAGGILGGILEIFLNHAFPWVLLVFLVLSSFLVAVLASMSHFALGSTPPHIGKVETNLKRWLAVTKDEISAEEKEKAQIKTEQIEIRK